MELKNEKVARLKNKFQPLFLTFNSLLFSPLAIQSPSRRPKRLQLTEHFDLRQVKLSRLKRPPIIHITSHARHQQFDIPRTITRITLKFTLYHQQTIRLFFLQDDLGSNCPRNSPLGFKSVWKLMKMSFFINAL